MKEKLKKITKTAIEYALETVRDHKKIETKLKSMTTELFNRKKNMADKDQSTSKQIVIINKELRKTVRKIMREC